MNVRQRTTTIFIKRALAFLQSYAITSEQFSDKVFLKVFFLRNAELDGKSFEVDLVLDVMPFFVDCRCENITVKPTSHSRVDFRYDVLPFFIMPVNTYQVNWLSD